MLIPAVDIKNNSCVRLKQGKINNVTLFSKSPEKMVKFWLKKGAKHLHLVDLNGAFLGKPKNNISIINILNIIKKFSKKFKKSKIITQIGGGVRNINDVKNYFNLGIDYIILGTLAIKHPGLIKYLCKLYPNKIIISLDIINNKAAINGWDYLSKLNFKDLILLFSNYGCKSIIYTDIIKDGMLCGINLEYILKIIKNINIKIIISGGVFNLHDIEKVCLIYHKNIDGVICGRSLYEKSLDFFCSKNYINYFKNI